MMDMLDGAQVDIIAQTQSQHGTQPGLWVKEMPKNFAELGAREKDIPQLVSTLLHGRNGSISGFVTLNEEDCKNIYQLMV